MTFVILTLFENIPANDSYRVYIKYSKMDFTQFTHVHVILHNNLSTFDLVLHTQLIFNSNKYLSANIIVLVMFIKIFQRYKCTKIK